MIRKIKVNNIKPNPFQSRKSYDKDSIKSLAEEIESVGLWAGALRGRDNNGKIELCFGHRRLEAIRRLGWKEVEIDLVKLTDEEMAVQGLIENLQREGLNDADRGDGIAAYIRLKTGSKDLLPLLGSGGKNDEESKSAYELLRAAKNEIAKLLGFSDSRIRELLRIAHFDERTKEPIRKQLIAGRTAAAAERIGGAAAVKAVAEIRNPNTGEDGLGFREMMEITREFSNLPEGSAKEKVRANFIKGKIETGKEVITKHRQFTAAQQTKNWKKEKPDLIDVIRAWTERATHWGKQINEVIPYMEYIDQEPIVAERWRKAVQELIDKLQKFV